MEFSDYLRFIFALIFVLALIGILTAVARRFGFGYASSKKSGNLKRLAIVEVMPVDAKRRLVLLKRDSTEHLVLLGVSSDLIVESSIPTSQTVLNPSALTQIEVDTS